MPTVSFPLEYVQRLTDTPLNELEQQAFDYGLDAVLFTHAIEVEVTAERPDLLSPEGFTRAINIYNGHTRTIPEQLESSGRTVHVSPSVRPLRPFIAALVIENVNLTQGAVEALIQFQEKATQTFGRQRKKIAIGVYDLDQIQGDIEYTAMHWDELVFVPLNGTTPLTARQILTEHPAGLLYAHTLPPGEQVPVLRDRTGKVLSLPPIINAEGVGNVTTTTQNLFIDVTGITEGTVQEMANILAHNFLDTGAVVKTVAIAYPDTQWDTPSLARRAVPFSAKFLNEMVGTAISKQDLGFYLSRMDLDVTGTDVILVPTYRTDIFSDIDIAGDLLVAVGIDNLQADQSSLKFFTGQADPLREFVFTVGDFAQRMGLMEVKNFILTDPELLTWFGDRFVQTGNAKSRTYSAVRLTLQAGLLDILSHNINAPKPINIYETGEVVHLHADGTTTETYYWGFASLDSHASFATAKAYVQTLLKALNLPYELAECQKPQYISGRAATVLVNGEPVGHFGEIHPEILTTFSFPEPICSGELDCQKLMASTKMVSQK
jgi:phenylalanyl-tRNA synthetase beta chain